MEFKTLDELQRAHRLRDADADHSYVLVAFLMVAASGCAVGLLLGWLFWGWA